MGQILSYPVLSKNYMRGGNGSLRFGSVEMQGYRNNMEDAMSIHPELTDGHALFGVFDGHSGARTSAFCASNLHKKVAALADPTDEGALTQAVLDLDAEICKNETMRTDGSTCVFTVVKYDGDDYTVTCSNTGDSRAILLRADGTFLALTEDHSPERPEETARIVAAGGTVSMNRVDGELAMSRAMGDWNYKNNPKLPPNQQKVISLPDLVTRACGKGDALLVACDGIFEQLENEQVVEFVRQKMEEIPHDPAAVAAALLDHSVLSNSKDNMSAIIIQFTDGRGYGPPEEYIPGPYEPGKSDSKFVEAYKADALKHGVKEKKLMKLAAEADSKNKLAIPVAEQGGPGRMNLRELLAEVLQGGGGSMEEKKKPAESPMAQIANAVNAPAPTLRDCSAPKCGEREKEGGERFMVCGRCKSASYCSRECQKRHWKAGHKKQCFSS